MFGKLRLLILRPQLFGGLGFCMLSASEVLVKYKRVADKLLIDDGWNILIVREKEENYMATYSSDAMRSNMPDMQRIREMEYFQGMYPQRMRELQQYVMEECDAWDYNGSPMYDEFPQQNMIEQASQRILSRLPEQMWMEMSEGGETDWGVQMQQVEQQRRPQGPPQGPPPGRPPQRSPQRPPQRPPQNQPQWLRDIIRLLLLNEIQNRRCRAGLC